MKGNILFELAHPKRVQILEHLEAGPEGVNTLCRRTSISPSEVLRHIRRMISIGMVEHLQDRRYALTQLGIIALEKFRDISFISRKEEYFSTHRVDVLPPELVSFRALREAEMLTTVSRVFEETDRMLSEASEHVRIITPQTYLKAMDILSRKSGLELRIISRTGLEKDLGKWISRLSGMDVQVRLMDRIPVTLILTERMGGVGFPFLDGEQDVECGFLSESEEFRHWTRCIFEYYWRSAGPITL